MMKKKNRTIHCSIMLEHQGSDTAVQFKHVKERETCACSRCLMCDGRKRSETAFEGKVTGCGIAGTNHVRILESLIAGVRIT